MRDRGPAIIAMTVSTVAVLATSVGALVAIAYATRPVAFGIGGMGFAAACLGLVAILQWMRDAETAYPDYAYHRARAGKAQGNFTVPVPAHEVAEPKTAAAPMHARPAPVAIDPALIGGNVVAFDLARARRKRHPVSA